MKPHVVHVDENNRVVKIGNDAASRSRGRTRCAATRSRRAPTAESGRRDEMTDTIETPSNSLPRRRAVPGTGRRPQRRGKTRPPRARHRSAILRRLPRREAAGHLYLPAVRAAAVPWRRQVRKRHRLAELHPAVFRGSPEEYPRHQLRHGPHRDHLRPLRIAPGPRVRRRSAADRPALLHQFGHH